MRSIIFCLSLLLSCVLCKVSTKSLTESLGQEVIEIEAPLKDLPAGLEEEPSAETEEAASRSTAVPVATRREVKKTSTNDGRKKAKDVDLIDGTQDDEAKVEKALADMYRDTNDYNSESAEVASTRTTNKTEKTNTEKAILRNNGRDSFKFQPDLNNAQEIERFRTSVDDISCDKSFVRKLNSSRDSAINVAASNIVLLGFCAFICF